MADKLFLDEGDLHVAFSHAATIMGRQLDIDARYYPYSQLKGTARLTGNRLKARLSEGFKAAPYEAVVGLALWLLTRLTGREPAEAQKFIQAYKEFSSSRHAAALNDSIQVLEGRKRKLEPRGRRYNLNEITAKVAAEYHDVLQLDELPMPGWQEGGKRRLGFFDKAFNQVVINSSLDSPRVPEFVVEYVVYHELLHAKHDVRYARGQSLRRTVHPRAFKLDERKFAEWRAAERFLSRGRNVLE